MTLPAHSNSHQTESFNTSISMALLIEMQQGLTLSKGIRSNFIATKKPAKISLSNRKAKKEKDTRSRSRHRIHICSIASLVYTSLVKNNASLKVIGKE